MYGPAQLLCCMFILKLQYSTLQLMQKIGAVHLTFLPELPSLQLSPVSCLASTFLSIAMLSWSTGLL